MLKTKFKKLLSIIICISMVICNSMPSLANANDIDNQIEVSETSETSSAIFNQLKEDLGEEKAKSLIKETNSDNDTLKENATSFNDSSDTNESSTNITTNDSTEESKTEEETVDNTEDVENDNSTISNSEDDNPSDNTNESENEDDEILKNNILEEPEEDETTSSKDDHNVSKNDILQTIEEYTEIIGDIKSLSETNSSDYNYDNITSNESESEDTTEILNDYSNRDSENSINFVEKKNNNNDNDTEIETDVVINNVKEETIDADEQFGTSDYWLYWYVDSNNIMHFNNTATTESTAALINGRVSGSSGVGISSNCSNIADVAEVIIDDTITALTCANLFDGFTNLQNITNLSNLDTSNVTSMASMFNNCSSIESIDLSMLDVSNITNVSSMFKNCSSLINVNISNLSSATNINKISNMFDGCEKLEELDLSWISRTITNRTHFLRNCSSLNRIIVNELSSNFINSVGLIGNWKNTSTNELYESNEINQQKNIPQGMAGEYIRQGNSITISGHFGGGLFGGDKSAERIIFKRGGEEPSGEKHTLLTANPYFYYYIENSTYTIYIPNNNDIFKINAWGFYGFENLVQIENLNNVTFINTLNGTFQGCKKLESIDFTDVKTINATDISYMCQNCENLISVDLSSFNISNVYGNSETFKNCNKLRKIKISESLSNKINSLGLIGNWKKEGGDTIYLYTSNKTTIPTESGEYNKAYTLSYDSNGGNAITEKKYLTYGETTTINVTPFRGGFEFIGWYKEPECTNQVTDELYIYGDSSVYAKWNRVNNSSDLIFWGYKANRLTISMQESKIESDSPYKGSFTNNIDFNNENDVPWNPLHSKIKWVSAEHIQCKSIAYWFKNNTNLEACTNQLMQNNNLLENMSHTFEGCSNIKNSVGIYYAENVKNISFCFSGCSKLASANLKLPNLKNMQYAFENCSSIEEITIYGISREYNIVLDENGFNCSFNNCVKLKNLNLTYFNFENYTSNVGTYTNLETLNSINMTFSKSFNILRRMNLPGEWIEYNTGNIYTGSELPNNINDITRRRNYENTIYWYEINYGESDGNIHITNTKPAISSYIEGHYFNGDKYDDGNFPNGNYEKIILDNNITIKNDAGKHFFSKLDPGGTVKEIIAINYLNTSDVTDMSFMFSNMDSIVALNLSTFNTSKVTNMKGMFSDCTKLREINLSSFNTSKVTDMTIMFESCEALTILDLSSFSNASLEDHLHNTDNMFTWCKSLTTIYASTNFNLTINHDDYDWSAVMASTAMFEDCHNLVGGNGTTYNEEHKYADYARIDTDETPGFFTYRENTNTNPNPNPPSDNNSPSNNNDNNNNNNNSYTGSRGGSTGGGGGGGGGGGLPATGLSPNAAPMTTHIAINKTTPMQLNGDFGRWDLDPITGKYKLNIQDANGEDIPITNGFFQVSKTVTQDVNGVPTQMPTNATYYFDAAGNMITGWVQTADAKWYFFENAKTADEGKMQIGWKNVEGSWYFFGPDGTLFQNAVTPDGYIVDANGSWVQV